MFCADQEKAQTNFLSLLKQWHNTPPQRLAICPGGGFCQNLLKEYDLSALHPIGVFDSYKPQDKAEIGGLPLFQIEELAQARPDQVLILSGEYLPELWQRVEELCPKASISSPFLYFQPQEELQKQIKKIHELRKKNPEKLLVIFATGRLSSNQIKYGLYLRKKNISVVLITLHPDINWSLPLDSAAPAFDLILCTNDDLFSYLYLINNNPADLIHLTAHMYQNHFSLLVTLAARCPVVCDWYDVLSVAYDHELLCKHRGERFADLQFKTEKLLCQRVHGIIHKDHSLVINTLKRKYQIQQPVLSFASYACQEFAIDTPAKKKKQQKIWKIVYIGGVHTKNQAVDGFFLTHSLYEIAQILDSQGICFDIYNVYDQGDGQFDHFQDLAAKLRHFSYHRPVPNQDLAQAIASYDLGWIVFDFSKTILKDDFYYASMGSKLFNYLEAGLPVLISREHGYMAELAEEYGFGLGIKFSELPQLKNRLDELDLQKMQKSALQARTDLSMDRHIQRLVDFYKTVLSIKADE